jgi:gentisate 1,2-dioxygenase
MSSVFLMGQRVHVVTSNDLFGTHIIIINSCNNNQSYHQHCFTSLPCSWLSGTTLPILPSPTIVNARFTASQQQQQRTTTNNSNNNNNNNNSNSNNLTTTKRLE